MIYDTFLEANQSYGGISKRKIGENVQRSLVFQVLYEFLLVEKLHHATDRTRLKYCLQRMPHRGECLITLLRMLLANACARYLYAYDLQAEKNTTPVKIIFLIFLNSSPCPYSYELRIRVLSYANLLSGLYNTTVFPI